MLVKTTLSRQIHMNFSGKVDNITYRNVGEGMRIYEDVGKNIIFLLISL